MGTYASEPPPYFYNSNGEIARSGTLNVVENSLTE